MSEHKNANPRFPLPENPGKERRGLWRCDQDKEQEMGRITQEEEKVRGNLGERKKKDGEEPGRITNV